MEGLCEVVEAGPRAVLLAGSKQLSHPRFPEGGRASTRGRCDVCTKIWSSNFASSASACGVRWARSAAPRPAQPRTRGPPRPRLLRSGPTRAPAAPPPAGAQVSPPVLGRPPGGEERPPRAGAAESRAGAGTRGAAAAGGERLPGGPGREACTAVQPRPHPHRPPCTPRRP